MLPTLVGVEPATSWSPVGHASNWATEAGNEQTMLTPDKTPLNEYADDSHELSNIFLCLRDYSHEMSRLFSLENDLQNEDIIATIVITLHWEENIFAEG